MEHRHPAGFWIEPAIDAILPGEPQHALVINTRRVEVGVPPLLGQRKELHRACRGIDPRDRVLPAFGDPGGTVGRAFRYSSSVSSPTVLWIFPALAFRQRICRDLAACLEPPCHRDKYYENGLPHCSRP